MQGYSLDKMGEKKKKNKKGIDDEEETYEIDEDSDFVIHEKYLKMGKIKKS